MQSSNFFIKLKTGRQIDNEAEIKVGAINIWN